MLKASQLLHPFSIFLPVTFGFQNFFKPEKFVISIKLRRFQNPCYFLRKNSATLALLQTLEAFAQKGTFSNILLMAKIFLLQIYM
jgi:hypothetical protein